jgi:hypothetical protein
MKNVICCGFVAVTLALSAAASAQDRKMDDKMDKMKSETSYTGCIERSTDRAFTLRHAMASSATTKKSTGKDSMAKDSMMKDAMASTLGLASTSVDLAKHVGRKVIVKGVAGDTMGGMATLTVKSIKMVGSSCS